MKFTYNGVEIDCTPEEFFELMKINNNTVVELKPEVSSVVTFENPPAHASIISSSTQVDPRVSEFISYLFRCKPDRFASLGRGPYVIELLGTGESFTVSKLMKLARAPQTLVNSAIRRAIDGGCVFAVSTRKDHIDRHNAHTVRFGLKTKIQLVQLGTPAEAKYARDFLSLRSKEYRTPINHH
jgi:hypothetical protein